MAWHSSFFNTIQCEDKVEREAPTGVPDNTASEERHAAGLDTTKGEEKGDIEARTSEGGSKEKGEGGAAEEDEVEPEDLTPAIREACQNSKSCVPLTKHFEHCAEKVNAGHGFKGEDCVEELFHMMHCVDNCAAPKLFVRLK